MKINIFGFRLEINKGRAPTAADEEVWFCPPALTTRVGDLTPNQLRDTLAYIRQHVESGGVLTVSKKDCFRRIHYGQPTAETLRSFSAVVEAETKNTKLGKFKLRAVPLDRNASRDEDYPQH